MGRAIVREPAAFLMDEPLSNLDAKLRVQMRAEIAKLQSDLGVTTIYVTHDQIEAMTMGDRVAVMRKGELQQVDDPQTLYDRPVNLFVGGFIGSPAMNMLDATITSNGSLSATIGDQTIALGPETLEHRPALKGYEGKRGDHRDPPRGSRGRGARRTTLRPTAVCAGGSSFARRSARRSWPTSPSRARTPRPTRRASSHTTRAPRKRRTSASREGEAVVVGRFGARSRIKEGEQVEAVVDTRALHFFDPETGQGIYDSLERSHIVKRHPIALAALLVVAALSLAACGSKKSSSSTTSSSGGTATTSGSSSV